MTFSKPRWEGCLIGGATETTENEVWHVVMVQRELNNASPVGAFVCFSLFFVVAFLMLFLA